MIWDLFLETCCCWSAAGLWSPSGATVWTCRGRCRSREAYQTSRWENPLLILFIWPQYVVYTVVLLCSICTRVYKVFCPPGCFWLEQQWCVHCLLTVWCFSAAGTEFVRPVVGYFCSLCQLIYADEDEAKLQHCSSAAHYNKYQVLIILNTNISKYQVPLTLLLVFSRVFVC